jgi:hypothetical protein
VADAPQLFARFSHLLRPANLAKNYAAEEGITFVLLNDEHDPNK